VNDTLCAPVGGQYLIMAGPPSGDSLVEDGELAGGTGGGGMLYCRLTKPDGATGPVVPVMAAICNGGAPGVVPSICNENSTYGV
jgi:hypothetical protein